MIPMLGAPLLMFVLVAAIQYPVKSGLPSGARTTGPAGAAGAPPRLPPAPPRPPPAGACPGAAPPGAWPTRIWASINTTANPITMVKAWYLVFIQSPSIVLNDSEVVAFAFADELFLKHLAFVIHDAEILFLMPVEHDFHGPRPRKNFRIFHGRTIDHGVRPGAGPAFDDVKRIAVIIAAGIEPCWMVGIIIQIGDVDDQRIAFPFCSRIPVVEIDPGKMFTFVHVNAAVVVNKLVGDLNHLRGLCDLKWVREVRNARNTRLEAIGDGILGPISVIGLPLRHSGRQIRNLPVGRIDNRT